MKQIITLLLIIAMAGVLWWQYHTQVLALEDHRRHEQDKALSAESQEQTQCVAQGQVRFRQLGYATQPSASVRGHYNARRAVCFVLIDSKATTGDTDWHNITLSDVARHIVYAQYADHRMHGANPSDSVTPYTCEVLSANGTEQTCKTEPEFRHLLKEWMQ